MIQFLKYAYLNLIFSGLLLIVGFVGRKAGVVVACWLPRLVASLLFLLLVGCRGLQDCCYFSGWLLLLVARLKLLLLVGRC